MYDEYIRMLNQANKNLGIVMKDGQPLEITAETIEVIQSLSDEQQRALFNQMYLIAEQRGHENIFTADKNSFRTFLIDSIGDFGWTIEDYMLEVLEGVSPQWVNDNSYTDIQQAENLVKDYEQKVRMKFHSTPFRRQFPTTIRDIEYRKYFYSSRFGPFVDRKIGMLNTSAEIWLQNSVLIDEVKLMCQNKDVVVKKGYSINNANGILKVLEDVKSDHIGFTQANQSYNADGVISITPSTDLIYLIMKASYYERMKVRTFSGAFNLEQMNLNGQIIFVPEDYDLGTVDGEQVLMVQLDRRSIVIALKLWKMGVFYVANQYKTNHWLGVEGIRSHNTFINAVAYTGEPYGNFTDKNTVTENINTASLSSDASGEIINSISVDGENVPSGDILLKFPYTFNKTIGFDINRGGILVIGYNSPDTDIYRTDNGVVADNGVGEYIIDVEHGVIYHNSNIVHTFTPEEISNTKFYIGFDV